jgi:hypothetical protein
MCDNNMRKQPWLFILVLFYPIATFAGPSDSSAIKIFPVVDNRAFQVGEKLTFGIYYQFIRVGTAEMEVLDSVIVFGREAIQIQTRARSASFFDSFYRVRDVINSYVDAQGYFSLKFDKIQREGQYYNDVFIEYDYSAGLIRGKSIRYEDDDETLVRDIKEYTTEITTVLYDVLASFYQTRLQKLETGMPLRINSTDNEQVYPIAVYVQSDETIRTNLGKYRCIKLTPKLRGDAIFRSKGQIWIWVTDDQYKIPLKVEAELFFGSIYVEIEKIEGHQLPLPSQQ